MNANHPLARAAIEKAAIASALALIACCVASLAFELENRWTLLASVIIGVVCAVLAGRNFYKYQRSLKGSR